MSEVNTNVAAYKEHVPRLFYEYWDGTQFVPCSWMDMPSGIYVRWSGKPKKVLIKKGMESVEVVPIPELIQAYLLLEGN